MVRMNRLFGVVVVVVVGGGISGWFRMTGLEYHPRDYKCSLCEEMNREDATTLLDPQNLAGGGHEQL